MEKEIRKKYRVKEKVAETPTVCTLKLLIDDAGERVIMPAYRAGQFITVYFPELGTPEGKSYSISSAPHESTFNITVKDIGLFSNKLCSLKAGDSIEGSLPYGYFYSENETSDLVMIAGGIGIAPFRSIIIDSLRRIPGRKLVLFYSNQTAADIIFKKEFEDIAARNENVKIFYFITREENPGFAFISKRMSIVDVIGNVRKGKSHVDGREFQICGSISFVRDFWRGLTHRGVSEETIYTEAFFSH